MIVTTAPEPGAEHVLVVGLSRQPGAMALLEAAARRSAVDRLEQTVATLAAGTGTSLLLLRTCLRLEVYAVTTDPDRIEGALVAALTEATGTARTELLPALTVCRGAAAVRHLFSVAAGLESAAVGEPQILGQVRRALARGRSAGTVDHGLARLVERAVHVGRRVRAETGLATTGGSLADPALDQAATVLGPLAGRRVLVVGAGAMADLTLAALRRHHVGAVTIASRTEATGRALAARTGATWIPLTDRAALRASLASADLVVSATAADQPVITVDLLTPRAPARVLVDLARPADIEPAVAHEASVTLITLDDLPRTTAPDELAVARARRLVEAEVGRELDRHRAATTAAEITELRTWAQDMAAAELARVRHRITDDPETTAAVEQAVHRIVSKLLHRTTVQLQAHPAAHLEETS